MATATLTKNPTPNGSTARKLKRLSDHPEIKAANERHRKIGLERDAMEAELRREVNDTYRRRNQYEEDRAAAIAAGKPLPAYVASGSRADELRQSIRTLTMAGAIVAKTIQDTIKAESDKALEEANAERVAAARRIHSALMDTVEALRDQEALIARLNAAEVRTGDRVWTLIGEVNEYELRLERVEYDARHFYGLDLAAERKRDRNLYLHTETAPRSLIR